jgi:hypothetical protein
VDEYRKAKGQGPVDPKQEIGPSSYDAQPDSAIHRRALFKLDLVLLSTVTIIYFLNFLDRYVSPRTRRA